VTTEPTFHRILVPTDFSDCSEGAWRLAQRLAGESGAELILLHVLVEPMLYGEGPFSGDRVRQFYATAQRWIEEHLATWAEGARAAGLRVRVSVRTGVPAREIVAAAADEQVDVIVVGTHGRGGVERAMIGSVADRVIRTAPCPVLSVRPPDSDPGRTARG
jgi:nucleotide-binding universal stress UspA family protein